MAQKLGKRGAGSNSGASSSTGAAPEETIQVLVSAFRLLADEMRLRILYYLWVNKELHVSALCKLLGQTQPAVSHHLALMRLGGLIERRREGKFNYYSVAIPFFSDHLRMALEAFGPVPRKFQMHEFAVQHVG
jgi:ArsR family transcriptional regulator